MKNYWSWHYYLSNIILFSKLISLDHLNCKNLVMGVWSSEVMNLTPLKPAAKDLHVFVLIENHLTDLDFNLISSLWDIFQQCIHVSVLLNQYNTHCCFRVKISVFQHSQPSQMETKQWISSKFCRIVFHKYWLRQYPRQGIYISVDGLQDEANRLKPNK